MTDNYIHRLLDDTEFTLSMNPDDRSCEIEITDYSNKMKVQFRFKEWEIEKIHDTIKEVYGL